MLLYRTILLMAVAGGLVVGIILVFVMAMSWSDAQRLGSVSSHLDFYLGLQRVYAELAQPAPSGAVAADTADGLRRLADSAAARAAGSGERLARAATLLASPNPDPGAARGLVGGVLSREASAHRELLGSLQDDSRRELNAAVGLGVVLPVFGLAFLVFLQGRILQPLNDLSYLLGLLARKEYAVAATDNVDPLLRPLFERYNRMVKRMHDLERGHLKREESLQRDVDHATRALVQQQAAVSRVERLAAVGEVSARLGHELRNPLSGVLMALTNLRAEIDSEDQDARLGIAIAELERIAQLLSSIVEDSRQAPERPRRLRLRPLLEELLGLVRYQLDDRVRVSAQVPDDLHCRLPETGLRHALLNLVLNAAKALGPRPGSIRVTAARTRDGLAIAVRDDGPGFPEELLDAGVHEYGSWRQGGTGLGLATVRRFAFANSGRLRLENLPEGGACVTLWLPPEDGA
jgi:signal transduction histidine kinase